MEIINIPIEKITPDPKQPRTIFPEEGIKSLAKSIQHEGIINPIEISPDFVIIVGERRFRAAKLAGLTTIPVSVRKIFPRERFIRQLNENLHTGHNGSMVAMDIANALAKILDDLEGDVQENIKTLGKKIGKDPSWIKDMLSLRKETGRVKEYLTTPKAKYTLIKAANEATTTQLQEKIKEKIIKGDIVNQRSVRELIHAVERSPEREKQLLQTTYRGTEVENIIKINQMAPSPASTHLSDVAQGIDVANKFQALMLAMKGLTIEKISTYDMAQIKKLIELLVPHANHLHAQITDIQQKQLHTRKKTANLKEGK